MPDRTQLIVGLGNPGPQYELTLHNAGFLVLDYFAGDLGVEISSKRWLSLYTGTRLSGRQLILLKPQTYMNRSGESVARFAAYFKIDPEDILLIHDDLDLEQDRIKMVARGGAGGHKGVRSVINHLGANDFARSKIGIGRPPIFEGGSAMPVDQYVLSRFSSDRMASFQRVLPFLSSAIRLFAVQGVETAMNRINRRLSISSSRSETIE